MKVYEEIEIIIVEDVSSDAELLARTFKKKNLLNNITILKDGEEVLNYFFHDKATATNVKLILLDLKLPKVNGIEVLRELKNDDRTKHIPVIVLTSSQEDRDLKDSCDAGADDYVTKPMKFEEFAKAASSLGMHWSLVTEHDPNITKASSEKSNNKPFTLKD